MVELKELVEMDNMIGYRTMGEMYEIWFTEGWISWMR
jgi:hypothetical protein